MTPSKVDCSRKAKRCAVCKIDLKGRFVYVDDATERLTGYTKEELFGKKFLDLVSESGHDLVSHILYHRSHCETFFDSTRLELLDRNKQAIPATIVFSLNFIAGNPVNFQIIVDADSEEEMSESKQKEYALRDFVHELLVLPAADYDVEAPRVLAEYLSEDRAAVYWYIDGRLDHLSASTTSKAPGTVLESVEPTALMLQVAETGGEYSCDSAVDVQRAVERFGTAPNEYIARLMCGEGYQYVVRLRFEEHINTARLQQRIVAARQVIQVTERLRPNTPTAKPEVATDSKGRRREHGLIQEAQLALASATQILNRLDKDLRA